VDYPGTVSELTERLRDGGYLADRGLATTLLVSLTLHRPVLLAEVLGGLVPPTGRLAPAQLRAITSGLAARRGLWADLVVRDPDVRWYLPLHRSNSCDVWLLAWERGQDTDWHDHGGSSGSFAAAEGCLVEQYRSDGIFSHRPDTVGKHQPALIEFDRRAAIADLDELPREFRLQDSEATIPGVQVVRVDEIQVLIVLPRDHGVVAADALDESAAEELLDSREVHYFLKPTLYLVPRHSQYCSIQKDIFPSGEFRMKSSANL